MNNHLDKTDVELIKMLRENGRMPLKQLSEKVFLTTPAVSSRLAKLEEQGYIKGYHADVDMEKLGFAVRAYIMITVSPEDSKKFIQFVKEEKNVTECSHITGPYSMMLKVAFPTTSLLDEFLGRLQIFGKTETQVIFSTIVENKEIDF